MKKITNLIVIAAVLGTLYSMPASSMDNKSVSVNVQLDTFVFHIDSCSSFIENHSAAGVTGTATCSSGLKQADVSAPFVFGIYDPRIRQVFKRNNQGVNEIHIYNRGGHLDI